LLRDGTTVQMSPGEIPHFSSIWEQLWIPLPQERDRNDHASDLSAGRG
jgi:hypothetical protein